MDNINDQNIEMNNDFSNVLTDSGSENSGEINSSPDKKEETNSDMIYGKEINNVNNDTVSTNNSVTISNDGNVENDLIKKNRLHAKYDIGNIVHTRNTALQKKHKLNNMLDVESDNMKSVKTNDSMHKGNTFQFYFKNGVPMFVLGPHCKCLFFIFIHLILRVSLYDNLLIFYYRKRLLFLLLLEYIESHNYIDWISYCYNA